MTARSLAGCLLLLLASISVVEITVDVAAHHGVQRHQTRVRGQHPSPPRVSQRSGPAVTATPAAPPVLIAFGSAIPIDHPASLPLVSASVFVPPRV
jgi:hypothetical protein